ncbi:unnamed protein product [Orchesella dallaii]|uniref:Odorant receptor n=1 Tax=Orchesella dallaii TaxID=48710 RepID=A0ABP1RI73_9HEXA
MFLAENFKNYLVFELKVNNFLTQIPQVYCPKSRRFAASTSSQTVIFYKIKTAMAIAILFMLWLQLIFNWDKISTSQRIQSVFYIVSLSFQIPIVIEVFRKRFAISELFNASIQFEMHNGYDTDYGRKFNSKKRNSQKNRVKLYTTLSITTAPTILSFFWVHLYISPCIPANLGYLFLAECNSETIFPVTGTILKVILLSIFTWIFLCTTVTVFLEYLLYTSFQCYCFLNYIRQLKNKLGGKKCNSSGIIKIYRQIQLLVFTYNDIHRGILTPIETTFCQFVSILSLYGTIGLSNSVAVPLQLIFAFMVVETTLQIFEGEDAIKVEVHRVSKYVLRKLRNLMVNGSKRVSIISLPVLSIHMGGGGNFFDETTPLVLLDFAINQTVGLLLMQ